MDGLTVDDVMQDASRRDLEDWFDSQFWIATETLLKEQIRVNEQDLIRGDIHEQARGKEGMLYRNDDQLRGGIIAMESMLYNLRPELEAALEAAWEARRMASENSQER